MSKGKILAVCVVWLILFGIGAVAWKWLVMPAWQTADRKRREAEQADQMERTSSDSHYEHQLTLALDSFSGYAVLRSPEFRDYLAKQRIQIDLEDDGANYRQRLERLRAGDVQMAAFTIGALVKVSAELNELPATIVAIIDETRGADAMVADKSVATNVDALNRTDMRFVLTPDSPSETLVRVVMANFHLDRLSADPFVRVQDAAEVVKRYRNSKRDAPQVYVLWEPYVSQILENSNMATLVDSSRFRGYIVDVLVASRDFLVKNEAVVRDVVGCYFRAAYTHRQQMEQLILSDARQLNAPLNDSAGTALVNGIWWKNTQENFAHMGLTDGQPLQHIEDVIVNITEVLIHTRAIDHDPTNGQPNLLFYNAILQQLQSSNFHPGLSDELVRNDEMELPAISAEDWEQLVEVGTLEVPRLVFARGSARLTARSRIVLDDLAEKLKSWPQYYVLIRGNASTRGNLESNSEIATKRAKQAEQQLIGQGIHPNRIRAIGVKPSGSTSVSFLLGQPPY